MKDEVSTPVQRCLGQMRSLCYLLDEPTTLLTIQSDRQTLTAQAVGQIAQDLRALSRGATICVALRDAPPDCPHIIAFSSTADDHMNALNARRRDG
ncbi:MAG: hypothetical protein ABI901_03100 [Roseiflexaceae bacterium]